MSLAFSLSLDQNKRCKRCWFTVMQVHYFHNQKLIKQGLNSEILLSRSNLTSLYCLYRKSWCMWGLDQQRLCNQIKPDLTSGVLYINFALEFASNLRELWSEQGCFSMSEIHCTSVTVDSLMRHKGKCPAVHEMNSSVVLNHSTVVHSIHVFATYE